MVLHVRSRLSHTTKLSITILIHWLAAERDKLLSLSTDKYPYISIRSFYNTFTRVPVPQIREISKSLLTNVGRKVILKTDITGILPSPNKADNFICAVIQGSRHVNK